jgi:polar amino acid transport system substrate-binding protein
MAVYFVCRVRELRVMKRILLAVLALLCTSVLTLPAPAIARNLKFITIDVAPWASLDKASGKPVGVFPAVVEEIARRTKSTITYTLHPFSRIDRELEGGDQDCTIIVWTEERSRIVVKGELVSNHPMGVIARKGVPLKKYEDLQGLTVSVLRGLSIDPRFDADQNVRRDYDNDYPMGLRKIAHGHIDAIAGAIPTIQFLARQLGLDGYLGDALSMSTIPLVLQCSKRSRNLDFLPQLNQAIRDMRDDGTLQRILDENFFT